MSSSTFFLLVLVVWVATGLLTAYVMSQRGHALFAWGLLGGVFGPLVLALALDAVRAERRAAPPRQLRSGMPGSGAIDVLVGIDGSPESDAALQAVVGLLGARIGRLTLATVLDFDSAGPSFPDNVRDQAESHLDALSATVGALHPETILLVGRSDLALERLAREGGYHLLAVGSRGCGRSKALLGSVATRLARGVGVPVLTVASGRGVPPEELTIREPMIAPR